MDPKTEKSAVRPAATSNFRIEGKVQLDARLPAKRSK